jgi:hypothetical protein
VYAVQQIVQFVNVSSGDAYKYYRTLKGTAYCMNNYAVLEDELHHKLS